MGRSCSVSPAASRSGAAPVSRRDLLGHIRPPHAPCRSRPGTRTACGRSAMPPSRGPRTGGDRGQLVGRQQRLVHDRQGAHRRPRRPSAPATARPRSTARTRAARRGAAEQLARSAPPTAGPAPHRPARPRRWPRSRSACANGSRSRASLLTLRLVDDADPARGAAAPLSASRAAWQSSPARLAAASLDGVSGQGTAELARRPRAEDQRPVQIGGDQDRAGIRPDSPSLRRHRRLRAGPARSQLYGMSG